MPLTYQAKVPSRPLSPEKSISSDEINKILRSLRTDPGLELPEHDKNWSPSKATNSGGEQVFSRVKFLYFKDRTVLDHVLADFRVEARSTQQPSDLLGALLEKLHDPTYLVKGRLSPAPGKQQKSTLNERLRAAQSPASAAVPAPPQGLSSRLQRQPCPATGSSDLSIAGRGLQHTNADSRNITIDSTTSAQPTTGAELRGQATEVTSPTEETGIFTTPPESPSQRTGKKRSSDELPQSRRSSKTARTLGKHYRPYGSTDTLPIHADKIESDVSATTSLTTSFASTGSRMTTSTTLTSFSKSFDGVEDTESEQPGGLPGLSKLGATEAEKVMVEAIERKGAEQRQLVPDEGPNIAGPSTAQSSDIEPGIEHLSAAKPIVPGHTVAQGVVAEAEEFQYGGDPVETGKRDDNDADDDLAVAEMYQVRDCCRHPLIPTVDPALLRLPFDLRLEAFRVGAISDVSAQSLACASNVDEMYELLDLTGQKPLHFERSSAALWRDPTSFNDNNVRVSAQIKLSKTKEPGPLIYFKPNPLRAERSTRLQRRYGWDRIMYWEAQSFHDGLPSHLKGQSHHVQRRVLEYVLAQNHDFLGRIWQAFNVQPIKRKKGSSIPAYRVALFAVSGDGLEPVSRYDVVNWAFPIAQNAQQPNCKAFARLDLSMSQTIAVYEFSPEEVSVIDDIRPDGQEEATEFNDPDLKFPVEYDENMEMTDGCSDIVGSAQSIFYSLGFRTSAIQVRINGAKGMFSFDDQSMPTHQLADRPRIKIRKSQLKIAPRPGDLSSLTCEPDRWSLDLVKAAHMPRTAHLHRGLFPILVDRGVPRDIILSYVRERIDADMGRLAEAVKSPATTLLWNHEHFASNEELRRSFDMPNKVQAKANIMIFSGFNPKESRYLREQELILFETHALQVRERFRLSCGKSVYVFGIADPTGNLKPGEAYLSFSEGYEDPESGEILTSLAGKKAIVTRNPTERSSDVQMVRIVHRPELAHYRDVLIVPSTGRIPFASKLQGGDYDGDTFLVCWESAFTDHFKNAPVAEIMPPEFFGIRKDTRPLQEVMDAETSSDPLATWMKERFKSRTSRNPLGAVTNYYENLAYKENTLCSYDMLRLADLHDHLNDADKRGLVFTFNDFCTYLASRGLPSPNKLPLPAYKREVRRTKTEKGMGPDKSTLIDRLKANRRLGKANDILDDLQFDVVDPAIIQGLEKLQAELAKATTQDLDLEITHHRVEALALSDAPYKSVIDEELKTLAEAHSEILNTWIRLFSEQKNNDASEVRATPAQQCADAFAKLKPVNEGNPLIVGWLMQPAPHAPSFWDCLKASTLYCKYHKHKAFVFAVAGRLLCYVKAHSSENMQSIVSEIHAIMKPRQRKLLQSLHPAPATVDEDDEDFGDEIEKFWDVAEA